MTPDPDPFENLDYKEMARQAKLVNRAADARLKRDELIRQLRAQGWSLRDLSQGAGISVQAISLICKES